MCNHHWYYPHQVYGSDYKTIVARICTTCGKRQAGVIYGGLSTTRKTIGRWIRVSQACDENLQLYQMISKDLDYHDPMV